MCDPFSGALPQISKCTTGRLLPDRNAVAVTEKQSESPSFARLSRRMARHRHPHCGSSYLTAHKPRQNPVGCSSFHLEGEGRSTPARRLCVGVDGNLHSTPRHSGKTTCFMYCLCCCHIRVRRAIVARYDSSNYPTADLAADPFKQQQPVHRGK